MEHLATQFTQSTLGETCQLAKIDFMQTLQTDKIGEAETKNQNIKRSYLLEIFLSSAIAEDCSGNVAPADNTFSSSDFAIAVRPFR